MHGKKADQKNPVAAMMIFLPTMDRNNGTSYLPEITGQFLPLKTEERALSPVYFLPDLFFLQPQHSVRNSRGDFSVKAAGDYIVLMQFVVLQDMGNCTAAANFTVSLRLLPVRQAVP
jgi:hypothetical protein